MDSPLVISFIIFIAAVGIGLWSQYCLPRLSDSRNILFHQDSFTGHFGPGQCLTQYGSILNALQGGPEGERSETILTCCVYVRLLCAVRAPITPTGISALPGRNPAVWRN